MKKYQQKCLNKITNCLY